MACFHPKKAFQIGYTASGAPKFRITPWTVDHVEEVDLVQHVWKNFESPPDCDSGYSDGVGDEFCHHVVTHFIPIPCGNCIGCRLDYARDWAVRLRHEFEMHDPDECWFITLTYSDEALAETFFDSSVHRLVLGADSLGEATWYSNLDARDMTLFWKRLRKTFPDRKLRYFQAGEYGERRGRCHFHAIVFDLPLDPRELHECGVNEFGQMTWRSDLLERLWHHGNVVVGKVTYESCAYVARYTLKKAKEMWQGDFSNRVRPFVRMSRNPGIGADYVASHPQIFDVSRFPVPVMGDKPLVVTHPRYYLKILKSYDEDRFNEIKFDKAVAGVNAYELFLTRDKPYLEQLRDRELDILRKASILKVSRKLDNS